MLDPLKVAIDHNLVVFTLATYVVGTLVLIGYFLLRTPLLQRIGMILACLACAMQFVELGARWNMTGVWPLTNLYGSLSLFSAMGVLIFIACLLLAKPLLDLAYYPMQLQVIDAVSRLEGRNEYAYIFNHEFGLFLGRFLGCGLFLGIAYGWSGNAALKYALPVIALLQLLSIGVAGQISRDLDKAGNTSSAVRFAASASEA